VYKEFITILALHKQQYYSREYIYRRLVVLFDRHPDILDKLVRIVPEVAEYIAASALLELQGSGSGCDWEARLKKVHLPPLCLGALAQAM
jgi:hypothetical protein